MGVVCRLSQSEDAHVSYSTAYADKSDSLQHFNSDQFEDAICEKLIRMIK